MDETRVERRVAVVKAAVGSVMLAAAIVAAAATGMLSPLGIGGPGREGKPASAASPIGPNPTTPGAAPAAVSPTTVDPLVAGSTVRPAGPGTPPIGPGSAAAGCTSPVPGANGERGCP